MRPPLSEYRDDAREDDAPLVICATQGEIAAIDRADGHVRWKDGLPGGGYGPVAIYVDAQVVYASPRDGSMLFCLDYATGETFWRAETASSGRATILAHGDDVFVCKGGVLDCFDRRGVRRWTQPLKGMGFTSAALGIPGLSVQADDG